MKSYRPLLKPLRAIGHAHTSPPTNPQSNRIAKLPNPATTQYAANGLNAQSS
jgi:hypothetical protein